MTLEQCVERDMIAFLEKETAGEEEKAVPRHEDTALLYLNREWQRDIEQSLKRNDIAGAKKIFNLLKQQYEETTTDHPVERRKRYEQLQEAYIQIVNFLQEHQRTSAILDRLESNADAVFDTAVKPVDLEDLQRGPRQAVPDVEPLTKKSLAANPQHGSSHAAIAGISLPPSPDGSVAPPPLPPPASVPAPKIEIPKTPAPPSRPAAPPKPPVESAMSKEEQATRRATLLATIKTDVQRATTLAKTRPDDAKQIIASVRTRLETGQHDGILTKADSDETGKQLDTLATTIDRYHDRKAFDTEFRRRFTALIGTARLKHADAIATLATLHTDAAAFEKENPSLAGLFTKQLERCKETYRLYEEDELIEKLTPLLKKVAAAKRDKDAAALRVALSSLEAFVRGLPHTPNRTLLERVVTGLRTKLLRALASLPRRQDPHGRLVDRLRAAIDHIKRAAHVRDRAGMIAGAVEMNRLSQALPAGPDKELLTSVAGRILTAARRTRV